MSEQPINNNWKWFRFITDKWDEYQIDEFRVTPKVGDPYMDTEIIIFVEEVEVRPIEGEECDWEKEHVWGGSTKDKPIFWIHYDDENGGIEENYQYCPNCGRKLRKD